MIIDGKAVAKQIREELARTVAEEHLYAKLTVIIVGDDPASKVYVRNKGRACDSVGILSETVELPEETTEKELLERIEQLNRDEAVTGILVQLPLPAHIDEEKVTLAIAPEKDVDGFHPMNVGLLSIGTDTMEPCTPSGIMELLHRYRIRIEGAHAVVIGRSNIVGKPIGMMLLREHATVTTVHSKTEDALKYIRSADIIIAAVGVPRFVTGDMIREGATVIDVGINRLEDGTLCGDVDFDSVAPKACAVTPVPGGVGPMTIAMLMNNVVRAARKKVR